MSDTTTHATLYGMFEATLPGPSDGNPFQDVTLRATFTRPDRSIAKIDGFYDGDGLYRVRFMPDAIGAWRFRTASNIGVLDGVEGTFEVGPAAVGVHGPVRVANGFHFAFADGTPYQPVGTTAYAWNHQGDAQELRTLETLRGAPFNKIRMCVFPKHYRYNENEPPLYPFPVLRRGASQWRPRLVEDAGWAFDFERFEPAFFRHLEQRIADLGALGVEADLILFHPYDRWGFSRMTPEQDDRYLRYLVARLSAFPNVWWSFANEYDLMASKTLSDWDRFLTIVAECDPVGHLRSIHNCFPFFDHRHPLVTHCSIQRQETARAAQWRQQYGKPVVIDECAYEGDIGEAWGNISGQELVHRFWDATVGGGYCTHGETIRHAGDDIWWAKGGALEGASIPRLHFLKELLAEVASAGLDPVTSTGPHKIMMAGGLDHVTLDQLIGADPAEPRITGQYAAAGRGPELYLAYFGRNQPSELTLELPQGVGYKATLIDTWDMRKTLLDGVVRTGDVVRIPSRPYQAMLFERVAAN